MTKLADPKREFRYGIAYTGAAYVLWGFVPLYFLLLLPSGPWEIVALRVLFSLVFCVILVGITRRGWSKLRAITRQPRLMWLTALAGVLIVINWHAYLIGALSGNVLETSLGYFINPIVLVLLGVFVMRERLRALQWVAVAIAALAVAVIIVAYGSVPWIALTLAFSFGLYGLVKKKLGPSVDAVSGLTLETVWLTPFAIIELIVVAATAGLTIGTLGGVHVALMAGTGIVTAVPLLLFAAGASRVPLTITGIMQFVAPVLLFLIGAFVLHEPMPAERWIGFGLVWVAIAIFTVDLLMAGRRGRRSIRTELL